MGNQRIEKMKEKLHPQSYPLCIEKGKLTTESFRRTEGKPQIIRRANALANILDNITILIEDDEIIVGNAASQSMGFELTFWTGTWSKEETDGLKKEGFTISPEDEKQIQSLNDYWNHKTTRNRMIQMLDTERLWPFLESGVVLPPWKSREDGPGGGLASTGMGLGTGPGIMVFDFGSVLNVGLNQVIEEAEQELNNVRFTSADSIKKADFLKSVIIAYKAIIRFANRFASLAADMASKEADTVRKKELERITETCRWVPAHPARSFYEAIQSFWFMYLMVNQDGAEGLGRFDQYMYPFYKRDIDSGKITDEEVLELLQCLRLKDMQLNFTAGQSTREKWSGMAKWHNMVIGGQTPDGQDATNELSYLILEAAKRCPTPHHTITVRVHDRTPEAFMLKALELVKTGIGMPAFVSDRSYIDYLLSRGVPIKTARDYVIGSCLEAVAINQSRILTLKMFVVPLVLNIFMHNGIEPRTGKQLGLRTGEVESFESFDALMKAFKEQMAYFMGLTVEFQNIQVTALGELNPNPVLSPSMVNGIKEGKDIFERSFPFENGVSLSNVGIINAADSLAAIKKLVFDEKKVTMKELKAALDANWQGNGYADMRKMFLAAPKYGNDDDYADAIAKDLYQFWADKLISFNTVFGGNVQPSAISISAQGPGGALTGATPDGRYAGECLADGAMSAMRGRDTHGPTALIKSAAKIDQTSFQSLLFNMKFHPSALKSSTDLRKLSDLIRTYFSMGGKHLQFNVVSRDTLIEAQKHPESHRDLIVRVAGYSAYFTQLGRVIQDEIIGRTEHEIMI